MSGSRKQKRIRRFHSFGRRGRRRDAPRWIEKYGIPENLLAAYMERYSVDADTAEGELFELGYYEEMTVQKYESEGIPYEYEYDGYTSDFRLVRKDGGDTDFNDDW